MSDKRVEDLEEAIYDIRDKVSAISIDTAVNKVQLEEHMRRTYANEEAIKLLQDHIEKSTTILSESLMIHAKTDDERIKPLEFFKENALFSLKLLASIGGILVVLQTVGVLDFVLKIYKGN